MIRKLIKKHTISFQHASEGLIWAAETQPNYVIHLVLSLTALIGGYFLRISYTEFLVIVVLIFVGLALETVNTAIEVTTDAVDRKWRQDIKVAKDVAAGAMLIYAIGSFSVACIIFIPPILALLKL